jgi:aminoglycoside phosphotransferase (APT) family kinase protein
MGSGVEGIDEASVTAWIEENLPDLEGPFSFELISGGRSNLTYRVVARSGAALALRRPPTGQVLPTAHDMAREFRVISALGPAQIPVPKALAICEDETVTGAPFYLMSFVEGLIVREAPDAERLTPDARRHASFCLVDTLAKLHSVDADEVGLGDLSRHDGYIARQLKRWYGQFTTSQSFTGRRVLDVDTVHDALAERVPPQQSTAIVHGDYRLDNTVLSEDGEVQAILDWEICTLGDPLADLGLLMVYWAEPNDPFSALISAPTVLPGFASREELAERYASLTGCDLSMLDFYVAFGYWKLACILEGVYSRYSAGAAAGDRSDYSAYAEQVGLLAAAAREALERL